MPIWPPPTDIVNPDSPYAWIFFFVVLLLVLYIIFKAIEVYRTNFWS